MHTNVHTCTMCNVHTHTKVHTWNVHTQVYPHAVNIHKHMNVWTCTHMQCTHMHTTPYILVAGNGEIKLELVCKLSVYLSLCQKLYRLLGENCHQ